MSSAGSPVVVARRPSGLQVTLLGALALTLAGLTVLSVGAVREARDTAETLARLEYVSREVTDLEVMAQEAYLEVFRWSVDEGDLAEVEQELALVEQKVRSMSSSASAIGFESELADVRDLVRDARATLPGLAARDAGVARSAIVELRDGVRFDLSPKVRTLLGAAGVSADGMGDVFGWFAGFGVALLVLIAAIFVVTRRDVLRNYERGHSALVEHDDARRRAERLNLAQVEVAEMIAAGTALDMVTGRCRELLDEITGRSWEVMPGEEITARDDRHITAEEESAATAFARLLAVAGERERLHLLLTRRALHDDLTGLRNRAGLVDRLDHAMARRRSANESLAVLFVDLDRFKQVNDSFGHRAGDDLLRTVGSRIGEVVRRGDTVSRLGGDEFVVILDGVTTHALGAIAARVHSKIVDPVILDAGVVTVGASIGVYKVAGDEVDADDVLRRADAAMYEAKAGSGGVVLFDEALRSQAEGRRATEQELREAVEGDRLAIHYQPIVDVAVDELVAIEALVRWQRQGTMLLPEEFLAVAEASGLVVGIDHQVLRRACRDFVGLGLDGGTRLAVNLSSRTLAQPDAARDILTIIEDQGCRPDRLMVEVTEAVLARSPESISTVQSLREHGVMVALDDFGTGYTSMGSVDRLPIDLLKLDVSLVHRLREVPEDPIVAALVALSEGVGVSVVAEGVESDAEASALHHLGCTMHQGFLYGHPEPLDRLSLRRSSGGVAARSC